jgi:hypothetical protein
MLSRKEIKEILKAAWDDKTCYPLLKNKWSKELPEIGQCAVTALLIQDLFGGTIVYNKTYDHFWNILPTGKPLDLTRTQFSHYSKLRVDTSIDRNEILYSLNAKRQRTYNRYLLLKKRVKNVLPVSQL